MPTHTFRFGLGDYTIRLNGDITIQSPEGIPYVEIYNALAEEAATAFKAAMRSRLDPPPRKRAECCSASGPGAPRAASA